MKLNRRAFLGTLSTAAAATLLPRRIWAEEPGQRKKGFALVGLGNYSTTELAPAFRHTKHCRLAGVVTGDPAKGRRWARQYGFPETSIYNYDTMEKMADNPDIDVVYVVTPNALHRRHVEAAARAGKHVITEKPMATSVADCDAMIAACKKAGVHLAVGYRLHYDPCTMALIQIAEDGHFGPFKSIRGANGFRFPDDATPQKYWRINRKLSGGGPLMDMGVYVIQEVCMTKVEAAPASVTAGFGENSRPAMFNTVEENIHWTMDFADGAHADCKTSYENSETYFHATAPRGWIDMGSSPFFYRGQVLRTNLGERRFHPVNQQALQMDGMVTEWADGLEARASGEMGRRDVIILEAIYESARNGGKRVSVVV
ncbi:MAG TPA: Gfo/Idh/MocA family oxidoreductase [Opitutaceae bacterium]|jgi:glucose-fructose oxidoreductase